MSPRSSPAAICAAFAFGALAARPRAALAALALAVVVDAGAATNRARATGATG
jgi:hypothetical protein